MTKYQVNVAAEAHAAVVLSQAGYDVAMQYGTTQPDWDLLATKGEWTLRIQVKGSQNGSWGLFQKRLHEADYGRALDLWLEAQPPDLIYFLVQFKRVGVGEPPRCYIARPAEIVAHMRTVRGGHAHTALREEHRWTGGVGAGCTDRIPPTWRISQERIDSFGLGRGEAGLPDSPA